jgi:cytochrome c1
MRHFLAVGLLFAALLAACGESDDDNSTSGGDSSNVATATAENAEPTPYPTLPAVPEISSCEQAADLQIERYQLAFDAAADVSMEVVLDQLEGPANYELFEDELERQMIDIQERAEAIGCSEDEVIAHFLERIDTLIADNPNAVQALDLLQASANPPTAPTMPDISEAVQTPSDPAVAEGLEIVETVCAACHTVAGTSAQGTLGPELTGFAGRPQIAGVLENNEENLRTWLSNPPAAKPGTAMPNLGLTQEQIGSLVAYLYTLEASGE